MFTPPLLGLLAAFCALLLEVLLFVLFFAATGVIPALTSPTSSMFLAFTVCEETTRYLFMRPSVSRHDHWIRAVVFSFLFGAGFAAFEISLVFINYGGNPAGLFGALIGAAFLHIALSIIIGLAVFFSGKTGRPAIAYAGFASAIAIHFAFNSIIQNIIS